MNVLVLFYSATGHVQHLAVAIAEGIRDVAGVEAVIRRVPAPCQVLPTAAQRSFAAVPIATVSDLASAEAILFGSPTGMGSMAFQMRHFLDGTGGLLLHENLAGKAGSVFTSFRSEPGRPNSALLSLHQQLLHHGMVLVDEPYSFAGQASPKASAGEPSSRTVGITRSEGQRWASADELAGARFQGRHVAQFALRRSA